jgi:hypothetical protein
MIQRRDIKSRISYMLWLSDLEAIRFNLAIGSILWGLFLLWPGDLFTPARTTYLVMAEIAPEHCWGTAFVLQGVVMMYSMLWGYRSNIYFIADALLGCVLWTASTAACFMAHYQSIQTYQPPAAMSYEIMGAASSWWVLVRYTIEQKKARAANG